MTQITNAELQAIITGSKTGGVSEADILPVDMVLGTPGISISVYARALQCLGAVTVALEQIERLEGSTASAPALRARGKLLRLLLDPFHPEDATSTSSARLDIVRQYLVAMTEADKPSAVSNAAINVGARPVRVEISSPARFDLAMGGLSDLAPWAMEREGRAVALCADFDSQQPIRCVTELTTDANLVFEWPNREVDILTSWQDIDGPALSGSIARACTKQLLEPLGNGASLSEVLGREFGGGLRFKISSSAPKGLGSSSIIASVILQAMLRHLGWTISWSDIVDRSAAVERLMGVGGGWEDALPGFFGGIVYTKAIPAPKPGLTAQRLEMRAEILSELRHRLILFDSGEFGYTGDILTEGILRYLEGDYPTLAACEALAQAAEQVAGTLTTGNLEEFGRLLTVQWEAWKTVTDGRCTTPRIDAIIQRATPYIVGAKVSGAGAGGPILFLVQEGAQQELRTALSNLGISEIPWTYDLEGYVIREWHRPQAVSSLVHSELPRLLVNRASHDRHGELVECHVEEFVHGHNTKPVVGPLNPAIFDVLADVSLTMLATAASVVDLVGTASPATLKSVKKRIDGTASEVFADELSHWGQAVPVGSSEGKDEHGEAAPSVATSDVGLSYRTELRTAVDVVDGTTPSATGQDGAYSICAVGEGLRSFPDLQAYAILAPSTVLDQLDMESRPEDAVLYNLGVIAEALGKRVDQLVVVTHSPDTGDQHGTLIQLMTRAGVSVIVPDPVIVEPPYAVAACIEHESSVDAMLGVFGLPEIAINTVLCGALNRGKEFVFRLASNTPLSRKEQTTLDGIFEFTRRELDEVKACGLDTASRYTFSSITSGSGCIFASACITQDAVLGLPGVRREGSDLLVEGWLADPCGNLHRIVARFRRPADIDYSARYPTSLFDISLLIELGDLPDAKTFTNSARQLIAEMRRVAPGSHFPSLQQTPMDSGLHVTVCELLVDYAPSVNGEEQKLAFAKAFAVARRTLGALGSPCSVILQGVERTRTGVIAHASIDGQLQQVMEQFAMEARQEGFGAVFVPTHHHVTLARFTEVLTEAEIEELDRLIHGFNATLSPQPISLDRLYLERATKTPFRDIAETAVIAWVP